MAAASRYSYRPLDSQRSLKTRLRFGETALSSRYAKGPEALGLELRSCQVVQSANKAELIRFDNRLTNDKQSSIGLFRFRVSPRGYCGTSLSA